MTKILYISPNGFMGGAERFIYNCAQGHENFGDMSPIFLFLNDGDCYREVKKLCAQTYLLPFKMRLSDPLSLIKTFRYIRALLKKEKISLIHATMPYAHIIAYFSSLRLGIKRLWFQHGPVGGLLDKVAVLLPVDKILFNSKYLQLVHNSLPFARVNTYKQAIIRLGIEENRISEHTSSQDLKCILSMGRICSWKGQLEVIKALHLLERDKDFRYSYFHFIILGKPNSESDHQYHKQMITYINDHNLENLVTLKGHTNSPHEYLNKADLFIHSSTTPEPFGLVVAEAMIKKCLVIGSDQGGVTDILKHGVTGITYNTDLPTTHEKLATALKEHQDLIFSDDKKWQELRENLINNAYHNIKENYSIKQMTLALESVYGEMTV